MTFPRWNFIFVIVFDILSSLWSPDGKGMISFTSPMCDVFLSFITFPFSVLDQVWYLMIVSTPDLCLLPNFGRGHYKEHFCVIISMSLELFLIFIFLNSSTP